MARGTVTRTLFLVGVVLYLKEGRCEITSMFGLHLRIGEPERSGPDALGPPLTVEDLIYEGPRDWSPLDGDPTINEGLFQGDIIIPSVDHLYWMITPKRSWNYVPVGNRDGLWPNAEVPYVLSSKFNRRERAAIAEAITRFHYATCVRFVARKPHHQQYLHLLKEDGCWSWVGNNKRGEQGLSLGPGCASAGKVQHELMHAIGFYHEQSRRDRDEFVDINWDNIEKKNWPQFNKLDLILAKDFEVGYDFNSLMHYSPYAFAKNKSIPTITAKDEVGGMGQRDDFSQKDLEEINSMYSCKKKLCIDKYKLCKSFSRVGLCRTTPKFMTKNCNASCDICCKCLVVFGCS